MNEDHASVQERILEEIQAERRRQTEKFGPMDNTPSTWAIILGEEVGEVCRAVLDARASLDAVSLTNYRQELIQVAAVAIAAIENLDMQGPI